MASRPCVRPERTSLTSCCWILVCRREDGVVVLERLKSNRLLSAIPVMMVTERDPEGAEQKTREYGAVAFLEKPIKADALIETIRGVLGTHA
jgi:DNA-binding response OmpR family regulator